jgi:HEPN domain-containing protein
MKKQTRAWIRKAEEDYIVAEREHRSKIPVHDAVCFHCQQCVEKYLKGLMEELGLSIPKTHFLDTLLNALKPYHPALYGLRRGLLFLSVFAVDSRYPGEDASKRQAIAALRWMRRLRKEARAILDIRERSERKRIDSESEPNEE